MNRYFLPFFLLSLALPMGAQTLNYTQSGVSWSQTITPEDLSTHLHILAADSMEGRETGKRGQRMAAAYIANHFETIGLKKVNGSYFQEVPLKVSQLKGGVLTVDDQQFLFKEDWVPYPGIEVSDVEGKAVFAGFGIQDETAGWDDYADLDVKDRIVIILSGEPGNEKKGYELTGTKEPSRWSAMRNAKREIADSLLACIIFSFTTSSLHLDCSSNLGFSLYP